ncbi:membrane protein [Streptomyces sodiiphilus]|uniref:Membrane protein n=1 Tax=Streptomyces sodiiphilus TaxID=226217 RepID=A0ABN2PPC7_9ACTN
MSRDPQTAPGPADDEPRPEPIRFYGTSWVDHSRMYHLRRFLLGLGAVLLAALGALVLRSVHDGLLLSGTAGWLRILVVLAIALSSAMAFTRMWLMWNRSHDRRTEDPGFRSILLVGFIGVLLAYGLRSALEAPGEKLLRRDYETALESHRRLNSKRSRNPARRRRDR